MVHSSPKDYLKPVYQYSPFVHIMCPSTWSNKVNRKQKWSFNMCRLDHFNFYTGISGGINTIISAKLWSEIIFPVNK